MRLSSGPLSWSDEDISEDCSEFIAFPCGKMRW